MIDLMTKLRAASEHAHRDYPAFMRAREELRPAHILRLLAVVEAARRWRHMPDLDEYGVFCAAVGWPHTTFRGSSCPIGDLRVALEALDAEP